MHKEVHTIRTAFDIAFLKELEEADEIKMNRGGHVMGFEKFVKRLWRKRGSKK